MAFKKVLALLLFASFLLCTVADLDDENEINDDNLQLESFSWSDCSDDHHAASISTISVAPDPISVPGNVTVGYKFSAYQNLTSPSPFSLRIQKKVSFFWIDIPCEDGQGSCDYPDFCDHWPLPSPCPPAYPQNGIPCTCPILQGDYNLPPSIVGHITSIGPKWLDQGAFRIKAWITDNSGKQLVCVQLNLSMSN